MIFKCETRDSSDSSTGWVLLAIHAKEKNKHRGVELGFWTKLGLWIRGKL